MKFMSSCFPFTFEKKAGSQEVRKDDFYSCINILKVLQKVLLKTFEWQLSIVSLNSIMSQKF